MKTHEDVFFRLLRAGLWGTPVEIPQGFDQWGSVAALAKIQSVLGVVAQEMMTSPQVEPLLPIDMKAKLKKFVLSNMCTHTMLNSTLMRVVTSLREQGIEGVLLKGQGLARNYPVPELRQCGDIDFYVGTENYLKACSVLKEIASWTEEAEPMDTVKHYDLKIDHTTIEVHRYSDVNASKRYDRIYQKYSDAGLKTAPSSMEIARVKVNVPSATFNAFYIFNHLWHHFLTSGIGLRQFCDWMLFLHVHKEEIDTQYLKQILSDMDLIDPWQSFGCVLTEILGLPEEDFPFYDASKGNRCSRIVSRVLTEGNFGKEREIFKKRRKGYLRAKFNSLRAHVTRDAQLFSMFPSHVFRQFCAMLRSGIAAVWKDATGKKRKKS